MNYTQRSNKTFNKKTSRRRRKLSRFTSYITTFLLIAALVLGGYLIFFKHQVFNIRNVEVNGTKSFVNETDLLELAKSRSYGQNLITFSSGDFEHSLLEAFQGAKRIDIVKRYPATLGLQIQEREPLAIIHDTERANFFLIDEDGYVLGQVEQGTTNFPEIAYTGEVEVGYFLEKEVVSIYFDLLSAMDKEKISASSMSVHPKYVSLYTNDSVEVLVGKDKNIFEVISTLSDLLKQLATEGKDVKRVDLRYDKVIVSYR